jgi:hypothetical protein
MELWIDAIDHNYNDFIQHADRIWKGVSPDVAEVELDGYKGQEEAISLIGIAPWILIRCSKYRVKLTLEGQHLPFSMVLMRF